MKKSLIAAAALALLSSAGAQAADIVTYQEQPVAAAAAAPSQVNWNGLYIGGTIGGSWANGRNKVINNWSVDDKFTDAEGKEAWDHSAGYSKWLNKKLDPNSFIGGLYAGYNFQPGFLSQSALKDVVFGVETDFLFNSGGKSAKGIYNGFWHEDVNTDGGPDEDRNWRSQYKTRIKQDWNGATRLRAGYALGSEGRFMPYIAGGVSYAKFKAKTSVNDLDFRDEDWEEGDGDSIGYVSKSKTRAGWNIGAGVDYILPVLSDHLVLRAEYRYTDFGTQNFKSKLGDSDEGYREVNLVKQKVKFNQNDFRVGVAYKF